MNMRRQSIGGVPASQEMVSAVALSGARGFTTTNHFQTADPGGEAGVAAGFGVAVLFSVASQAVASTPRILTERQNGSVAGYTMYTLGTNTSIRTEVTNGAAASVTGPIYTITAGDVGKVMMAITVHDSTNIRMYVNRAEVAAAVPIVGYTASASRQYIGSRGAAGFPADGITIYGVSAFRGTYTLKQIQSLFDDVKLARDICGSGLLATNAWSVKRSGLASLANQGSGSDAMTAVGTPTADLTANPTWGW